MTLEEAIRIIDPKTTCDALNEIDYFGGFPGEWARAIALCEAMSMAAAALREQEKRRWIPATDRLPRNYTAVLAYIPSLAQTKQQTVHECHIGADGEWHSATAPAYREAVTHWMPLPKPPKEV